MQRAIETSEILCNVTGFSLEKLVRTDEIIEAGIGDKSEINEYRLKKFIEKLKKASTDNQVVGLVSHGHTIFYFMKLCEQGEYSVDFLPNAGIAMIDYQDSGRPRIVDYSPDSHL